MINLLPAIAATILASHAGSQDGQLRVVPTGIILSGVNDNGPFLPFVKVADRVKSLRHFEKFEDELLCSKQGDNAFIFVKKTYPAYMKIRFRRHILGLLVKTGYDRTFEYRELATPEFEPYLNSVWVNTPSLVPNPNTKLAFKVRLVSSTIVNGNSLDFSFSPSIKMTDHVKNELDAAPVKVLTNRDDITARLKSLSSTSPSSQYRLMQSTPVPQEMTLVREALENFRLYFDQENSVIDAQVETVLTDPIWNETKARRKAKDMRDLQRTAPNDFKSILGIHKFNLENFGKVPSNEEMLALQVAPLNHQYGVNLTVSANGKQTNLVIPL